MGKGGGQIYEEVQKARFGCSASNATLITRSSGQIIFERSHSFSLQLTLKTKVQLYVR